MIPARPTPDTAGNPMAARRFPAPALALLAAAVLTLLLLAHHPTLARGLDDATHLRGLVDLGTAAAAVHGLLAGVVGALLYGVIGLGVALGPRRPAVAFGLAAYGIGCAGLLGAMLFDGYVTAGLAARLLAAGTPSVADPLLTLVGICIQGLTKAGLAAMGIGMCCLSWSRARETRVLAVLAPLAGLAPTALAAFAGARLNPHNLMALTALQALWYAGAALTLWRIGAGAPDQEAVSR